ncbi:hypothetical protein M2447_002703 [Ereboglobus sp. PH5-10]|uniref:hypothetical protein n=1 Tax=Ereboglobus sp. PH5-10 TaxID=2940629 RepID=UPI002406668D|nr:hypothetical protein [Ereboglobus sp. PH5-10]MDF9828579.1 hypothetical protein [Ereboglobus sp. PH5-10]
MAEIPWHAAGNGLRLIPSNIMITCETTFSLELLNLPKGRKRTALRIELLHNINLGETAIFRFLRGYLTASLCASTDDEGEPLDKDFGITSIATESLLSAWAECSRFIRENETNLTHLDDEHNGQNLWLTRCRHGAGFWSTCTDDESAEYAMQQLTNASHGFGEIDLYLGDDKKLHFSNEGGIV